MTAVYGTNVNLQQNLYKRIGRSDPIIFEYVNFGSDFYVLSGLETRSDQESYQWDGERRGADPDHPQLLLQFSLAGRGFYSDSSGEHDMVPGTLFAAPIPSAHRYGLPDDSASWSFFYLLVSHPYVVCRLRGPSWTTEER